MIQDPPALQETAGLPEAVPGSRLTVVVGYVVALLLGVLFGVLGTVVHQSSFSVFGLFDLPIGLVVALSALAVLLTGLRLIHPTRLPAFLAAVGAIGMVTLFALPSPGGSVLIPAGVPGMVWLVGSSLVAVVVIAWPGSPRPKP